MPLPLYYISAEEYSKKNASGFDAQRNCFRCSSKPLSSAIEAAFFFFLRKDTLWRINRSIKKTFTDEHGAASVNVVEVVVPMIGEKEVLFIYLPFWSVHRHT